MEATNDDRSANDARDELVDGILGASRALVAVAWPTLIGSVTDVRTPRELLADETLEHALRELIVHGRAGLPVLF